MIIRSFLAIIFSFAVLSDCSTKKKCGNGFERYQLYFLATTEDRYTFSKSGKMLMPYYSTDYAIHQRLEQIGASKPGRDIGVEAAVCAKVQTVTWSSRPYPALEIQSLEILKTVDLTELRNKYMHDIGFPGM